MNKDELIKRIVDSFDDMSSEDPSMYDDMTSINLIQARMYLMEARNNENYMDLEEDERLPEEVTPQLYMEAMNCYIRYMHNRADVIRLADYLTRNEMVCEYDQYRYDYEHNSPIVVPVDFIINGDGFPFDTNRSGEPDITELLCIGMNSVATFSWDDEYCWFNKNRDILFSSNTPYADGIIDAKAFAEYIIGPDGHDCLEMFISSIMDKDDIKDVFRCSESEVRKRYSLS